MKLSDLCNAMKNILDNISCHKHFNGGKHDGLAYIMW